MYIQTLASIETPKNIESKKSKTTNCICNWCKSMVKSLLWHFWFRFTNNSTEPSDFNWIENPIDSTYWESNTIQNWITNIYVIYWLCIWQTNSKKRRKKNCDMKTYTIQLLELVTTLMIDSNRSIRFIW